MSEYTLGLCGIRVFAVSLQCGDLVPVEMLDVDRAITDCSFPDAFPDFSREPQQWGVLGISIDSIPKVSDQSSLS